MSFGGKTVDLADITFAFHLDADGTPEQAAAFRGSALFVFDRDMNGRPRNGAELFGPRSSANFHERREEDEHPGGWSDEEDAAHQLLRLLSKDSNLNDGLEGSADLDGDATGFDRAVGAGCAVKHIDLAV